MKKPNKFVVLLLSLIYGSVYLLHDLGVFDHSQFYNNHNTKDPVPASQCRKNSDGIGQRGISAKSEHYCPFCSGFTGGSEAISIPHPMAAQEKIDSTNQPIVFVNPGLISSIRAPPPLNKTS